MIDKPTPPVSFRKEDGPPSAPGDLRPQTVLLAVAAMGLSALAALIAGATVYTSPVKNWLTRSLTKSINDDYKDAVKAATSKYKNDAAGKAKALKSALDTQTSKRHDLSHTISLQQRGVLISVVIAALALIVVGLSVYRGKYWSRWGVIALWFLGSFTGTLIGIGSVLSVGASSPNAYKIPAFFAGLAFLVAVILVNLRPSVTFFALNKPVPPAGSRAARPRRSLFSPGGLRPPADTGASPAARAPARTRPVTDQARTAAGGRSKQRANAAAVAKGADVARNRAKAAAKSRRTES